MEFLLSNSKVLRVLIHYALTKSQWQRQRRVPRNVITVWHSTLEQSDQFSFYKCSNLSSSVLEKFFLKKVHDFTTFLKIFLSLSKTVWPVYIHGLELLVKVAQSVCPPHIRYFHSLFQSYPLFVTQLKSLPLNAVQNDLTLKLAVTGVCIINCTLSHELVLPHLFSHWFPYILVQHLDTSFKDPNGLLYNLYLTVFGPT